MNVFLFSGFARNECYLIKGIFVNMAKENDEAICNALLMPERSSSTPKNDNHDPGSHPDESQKTKPVINSKIFQRFDYVG